METKKSNKGIIILLIIIILGLVGYIIFDKMPKEKKEDKKQTETTTETTPKTTTLATTDPLVIKLFTTVREDQWFKNLDKNASLQDNMGMIALGQLPQIAFLSYHSCQNLDPLSTKRNYCGKEMNDAMSKAYYTPQGDGSMDTEAFQQATKTNSTTVVDATLLESKIKEIFGQDINFDRKDIEGLTSNTTWHYNQSENVYAEYGCICGGTQPPKEQIINSATKDNDTITIVTTLTQEENKQTITYTFTLEKETNNYIYKTRIVN